MKKERELKARKEDEKLKRELILEKRKEKILEKMQMRKEWKQLDCQQLKERNKEYQKIKGEDTLYDRMKVKYSSSEDQYLKRYLHELRARKDTLNTSSLMSDKVNKSRVIKESN